MKKIVYRLVSITLALLLAINTAAAGRWLRSCGAVVSAPCADPCQAPACCPEPVAVETDCGCDASACKTVESVSTSESCGCGSSVVSETVVHPSTEHVHASQTPTLATPETAPAVSTAPIEEVFEEQPAAAFGSGFRSDNAAPAVVSEPPSNDWDAGFGSPAEDAIAAPVEEPTEGPVAMEPVEDLFSEPEVAEPAMQSPMPTEMVEDEPADDLFSAGSETMAADEPAEAFADEDFDAEIQQEPAGDDLFGSTPEPSSDAGMTAEPEAPADDLNAADDLFGEDSNTNESAADDLFGSEPVAPASAEEDSLFGTDEMFDEPAEAGEPADEAAEDLFGEPADEAPMTDAFDVSDDADTAAADDLFGEDFDDNSAPEAPAVEESPADDLFDFDEPSDEAAEDDLFGDFGAILHEPGGVNSHLSRTWVDNTGRYSMVGRLVAVDGDSLRLQKREGGVARVPLSRLSQGDLEFVTRQVAAQQDAREWAIAHGMPVEEQPRQASSSEESLMQTAQL